MLAKQNIQIKAVEDEQQITNKNFFRVDANGKRRKLVCAVAGVIIWNYPGEIIGENQTERRFFCESATRRACHKCRQIADCAHLKLICH
jgi:hypothetical protein